MANEISCSCSLSASKNGASVSGSGTKNLDLSGSEMISNVQTFGTSEAAVVLGGCDQAKKLLVKNLDAAATFTLSLDNPATQILSVIQPGDAILLSGVSTTLYGKSSSGTINVNVVCVED